MNSLGGQNAFANPSFLTVPSSRPPSRGYDSSPDGKQSLKYIEDEEGFVEKSFVQLPKGDSGMVSLFDVGACCACSAHFSFLLQLFLFFLLYI